MAQDASVDRQVIEGQMQADDKLGTVGRTPDTEALRDARRALIAYGDTECALKRAMFQEGTMRMNIVSGCLQSFTTLHALALRNYCMTMA